MRLGTVAVTGRSMLPSLAPGDWLIIGYGLPVRPGDLVLVRWQFTPLAVKRAIRFVDGGLWVQGDNHRVSTDSRELGWVREKDVLGRVLMRYRRGDQPDSPARRLA